MAEASSIAARHTDLAVGVLKVEVVRSRKCKNVQLGSATLVET